MACANLQKRSSQPPSQSPTLPTSRSYIVPNTAGIAAPIGATTPIAAPAPVSSGGTTTINKMEAYRRIEAAIEQVGMENRETYIARLEALVTRPSNAMMMMEAFFARLHIKLTAVPASTTLVTMLNMLTRREPRTTTMEHWTTMHLATTMELHRSTKMHQPIMSTMMNQPTMTDTTMHLATTMQQPEMSTMKTQLTLM